MPRQQQPRTGIFRQCFMINFLLPIRIEGAEKVNRELLKYLLRPVCEQASARLYFQKPLASTNHLLLIIPHGPQIMGATNDLQSTVHFPSRAVILLPILLKVRVLPSKTSISGEQETTMASAWPIQGLGDLCLSSGRFKCIHIKEPLEGDKQRA